MVNGLISIGIFLVIQLVAAVWWASSISTKMGFVLESIKSTKNMFDGHVINCLSTFSTKEEVHIALVSHEKEVASALSLANKELSAMWKQIDKMNGNIK